MNAFAVAGYGIAGLCFVLLALLLLTGWQGRAIGARLIAASAITAVWAAVLAAEGRVGHMPFVAVYVAEIARDAAWLLVLTELAMGAAPRVLIIISHVAWISVLLAGLAAPFLSQLGVRIGSSLLLSRAGLSLTLVG